MADVNDIVCLGLGGWSSVYSLPTLGFGIKAEPAAWRLLAAQVYVPGAVKAGVNVDGALASEVYIGGATKAEEIP